VKNSDRYKDIFSGKENLTRSEVESYEASSGEAKNIIEQKMENDSFEQDAMEGWEEMSYNTSSLDGMNSKLFPKKGFSWGTAFVALTIGVVSVLLIQNITSNKDAEKEIALAENVIENSSEEKEINIESADVVLPTVIAEMQEVASVDQIKAKDIIVDFVSMEEITINLPPLEPSKIPQDNNTPSIVSSRVLAKEIYLHDLKLIDYRLYRSKPVVQTKQLILTGTSADKENEHSQSFNSNWENVDIPYMDYLEKSVYYFNKGKNKKALARFETILSSYKDDVNANFYGGLCLYNLGEYSLATSYFKNCLNSSYNNFDEEALWIMAQAYERMKNSAEANRIFLQIAESKSFYSQQAKKKLK